MTVVTDAAGRPSPFDDSIYASTLQKKIRRSFELAGQYYGWSLPRYFLQRREAGLPIFDWIAFWNPVRSFRTTAYQQFPLPPGYEAALEHFAKHDVRIYMPRLRLEGLLGVWWQARQAAGEVIECGAYRGSTSLMMAYLGKVNGLNQKVLLLDTFAGMPETTRFDSYRTAGDLAPDHDQVAKIEAQAVTLGIRDRIVLHKGLFAETFVGLERRDARFAFAHIDANIYSGTLEACEFVIPRLNPGAGLVFDDYNGLCDLGARLAIDRYFADHGGTKPLPLAECSAYMLRQ
jgi:hypothetical protein